jgi:CotS family spore coat protein
MICAEAGRMNRSILDAYGAAGVVKRHRTVDLIREEGGSGGVLKRLSVGALQALLITDLLENGRDCPVLPKVFRPRSGRRYLWFQGNRYLFTELLDGREADYRRVEDLRAAIGAMRRFHDYGRQLIAANFNRWMSIRINLEQLWRARVEEMEACRSMAIRSRTTWSKQYLKLFHHYCGQAHRAIYELRNSNLEQMKTVCYHDWAFHNVLIQPNGARLIDFDYIIVDHPVHDKTNLIGRYLRLFQWSSEALFRALWNFDCRYGWRRGELRLLRTFLTFPYDFWILGRQYFIERQPWSRSYYQEQWDRKIAPYEARERILELLSEFE